MNNDSNFRIMSSPSLFGFKTRPNQEQQLYNFISLGLLLPIVRYLYFWFPTSPSGKPLSCNTCDTHSTAHIITVRSGEIDGVAEKIMMLYL
jgi:hypothetical protein